MEKKALLWFRDSDLNSTITIGVKGGLYKVPGLIQALVHSTVSPCELWHRRFNHLHFKALPGLQKIVSGVPPFQFDHDNVCKGCVLGKIIKKVFHYSYKRAKEVLDLIHSNVCGPMSAPSLNGYLYYVIFIDDLSRKSWIYFMKATNETFNKSQEFKAMIELQIGKHIKILQSDNGGEFESNHFEEFCKEAGIRRQLTVPYNPQQNGVAERKNISICEAAKAMLHDLDLPTSLWAEATGIAVYIQNRCPHAILGEKTPEEAFTREKPDASHLRIF